MKGQLNHIAFMTFGYGTQTFNQMLYQFFHHPTLAFT
jgi:hypothetical protein